MCRLTWYDIVDFVGPKKTQMTDKNIFWLKKLKTISFLKYWDDNILDQL